MSAAERLQLYSVQNTNSFYMHHENALKKCYLKGVHGLHESTEAACEGKKDSRGVVCALQTNNR